MRRFPVHKQAAAAHNWKGCRCVLCIRVHRRILVHRVGLWQARTGFHPAGVGADGLLRLWSMPLTYTLTWYSCYVPLHWIQNYWWWPFSYWEAPRTYWPQSICLLTHRHGVYFPLSYMHLVCLVVMGKLLALWLRGPVTNRYHLLRSDIKTLGMRIPFCSDSTPCDFQLIDSSSVILLTQPRKSWAWNPIIFPEWAVIFGKAARKMCIYLLFQMVAFFFIYILVSEGNHLNEWMNSEPDVAILSIVQNYFCTSCVLFFRCNPASTEKL